MANIPEYKDLLNNKILGNTFKDKLSIIIKHLNYLASDEAKENRESLLYEKYGEQYNIDMAKLQTIRNASQELADICNQAIYMVTYRSLKNKLDVEKLSYDEVTTTSQPEWTDEDF